MKTQQIRIPENIKICLDVEERNTGIIVQFNQDLWAIFRKNPENQEDYGFQLLNPNTNERGEGVWGLTQIQCTRVINKLIKNPGYGFGKKQEDIKRKITKIIKKIKTTYI